jgi:uracil-DNA glycosylase
VADANSQSRNDPLATACAEARAWIAREIDLGLEIVPERAAIAENETVIRARVPASSEANSRADADTKSTEPSPRPAVRELSELLVEPAVRSAATLTELREVIGDCSRCKLCKGRTNVVFGVGNPEADLMFVGEGPGEEEDRQGVPFVGRAGMLLTDIITKGMGLPREQVYIANVVKCRPPKNRNPEPDEIVACEPFLHRQIGIIRPRVIVTLGKFATQVLLRSPAPISKLRGQWHEYQGVPLMATFHPAYLLRNPSDKRLVWEDVKQVMARLNLPVPARSR